MIVQNLDYLAILVRIQRSDIHQNETIHSAHLCTSSPVEPEELQHSSSDFLTEFSNTSRQDRL